MSIADLTIEGAATQFAPGGKNPRAATEHHSNNKK